MGDRLMRRESNSWEKKAQNAADIEPSMKPGNTLQAETIVDSQELISFTENMQSFRLVMTNRNLSQS